MAKKKLIDFDPPEIKRGQKFTDVEFEFDEADFCAMLRIEKFFEDNQYQCERIPKRAYQILFSKIKLKHSRLTQLGAERLSQSKKDMVGRFKSEYGFEYEYTVVKERFDNPEFDFPGIFDGEILSRKKNKIADKNNPKTKGQRTTTVVKATFEDMINKVISHIEDKYIEILRKQNSENHKRELFDLIYMRMSDYVSTWKLSALKESPLLPFHKGVMTGYLLWKSNIAPMEKPKNGKHPSNQELFKLVRHHVDRVEGKSKKAQK